MSKSISPFGDRTTPLWHPLTVLALIGRSTLIEYGWSLELGWMACSDLSPTMDMLRYCCMLLRILRVVVPLHLYPNTLSTMLFKPLRSHARSGASRICSTRTHDLSRSQASVPLRGRISRCSLPFNPQSSKRDWFIQRLYDSQTWI